MTNIAERLNALSPRRRALLEMRLRERVGGTETIPRRRPGDPCPLSPEQERLWFISRLEPDSPAYNLTTAVRVGGRLRLPVLKRSLDALVARHEILRTTFPERGGVPYQLIADSLSLPLPVLDASALPEEARERLLQRVVREEANRPFDLSRGPLLRATLLRFGETEHALVCVLHHIITDWWSFDLIWRELTAFYQAFVEGQPPPLAELPVQYADFAIWQRGRLRGESLASLLAYWKRRLAGANFIFDLPTDRPRPPVQTYRGKRQYFVPTPQLWDGLWALCREGKATPFMTLLAAFYTLLHRYTGREDIIVGTPYADRNMIETEGLIGYLLDMLILRADISGEPTFRELLRRVREVTLGAYAHHELPLAFMLKELHIERDPSRNPLFQVGYVFTNSWGSVFKCADLALTPVEVDNGQSKFDLSLGIRSGERDPLVIFEYNRDLFDDDTIALMMGRFRQLLEGVVADPEQRLADLPFFTDEERRPRPSPSWRAGAKGRGGA